MAGWRWEVGDVGSEMSAGWRGSAAWEERADVIVVGGEPAVSQQGTEPRNLAISDPQKQTSAHHFRRRHRVITIKRKKSP